MATELSNRKDLWGDIEILASAFQVIRDTLRSHDKSGEWHKEISASLTKQIRTLDQRIERIKKLLPDLHKLEKQVKAIQDDAKNAYTLAHGAVDAVVKLEKRLTAMEEASDEG